MDNAAREWDQAAAGWNRFSPLIRAWLREATQAMLDAANITTGSRVLDAAAGTGDQSMDILDRVGVSGFVLATDVSPAILDYAIAQARARGHANLQTRVADAQTLDLAGENFDAVVCRLGLMFCTEPARALTQMHAALKPGGRFAALVFGEAVHNPCVTIPFDIACRYAELRTSSENRNPPGTLLSLGAPSILAQLMDACKFVDVQVTPLNTVFWAPSVEVYTQFLRASAAPLVEILARLPASSQAKAWDDIAQELDVFSTPNGWEGPKKLLLLSAQRGRNRT